MAIGDAMKIQKNFKKLIIANLINRFGDGIDSVALTWLMYKVTRSASWSAIFYACNQLPSVIFQPFAGAIIETMDKRKIMVLTDIIRGFLVGALLFFYSINKITPILLIGFTLLISTVEALRVPAGTAILPQILDKQYYDKGIGLNSTASTVAVLLGTALSGVIVEKAGYSIVMMIDIISFLLSAGFIAIMKIEKQDKHENTKNNQENKTAYRKLFLEGLEYSLKTKNVSILIILAALINGFLVPINALIAPLISGVFSLGMKTLSIFSISLSLGTIVGALIYSKIGEKIKNVYRFITIAGMFIGIEYVLIYILTLWKEFNYIVFILSFIGFTLGVLMIMSINKLTVVFMNVVEQDYIARVGALFNSVSSAMMPVLSFIISGLTAIITVENTFLIFGIFATISMGTILFILKEGM